MWSRMVNSDMHDDFARQGDGFASLHTCMVVTLAITVVVVRVVLWHFIGDL